MENTFVYDCPRVECGARKMTFDCNAISFGEYDPQYSQHHRWNVFGTCRQCGGGLTIDTYDGPRNMALIRFNDMDLVALRAFPAPPVIQVSDLLPEPVAQAMAEAEQTLIGAPPRVARGEFRTVLDVATQYVLDQNPKCEANRKSNKPLNLSNRIDVLTSHHLLSPSLKDWAHGVRGITNGDVHGANSVSPSEAQEIAQITRMILVYLFEMPARVEQAKKAAEQKRGATSSSISAPTD